MGKVIYLTGAPASGKSSTARMLSDAVPNLFVWEYGEQLTKHLNKRLSDTKRQDEIRKHSSAIVTPKDVEEVDQLLVNFVAENRSMQNIIIDSHPVTKEAFGFRITPFSLDQFSRLSPDEIWVLYASPSVTIQRIANDPAGRPSIGEEEARFHTMLQASIAATYGASTGRAVYLFDSNRDRTELLDILRARIR